MRKISAILAIGLMTFALSGCGNQSEETVYVESVRMICGLGPIGISDQFAGIVTPQSETEIKKSSEETVAELKVKAGDAVKKDQVLFVYDTEQVQLNFEKAQLEAEQMKNTIIVKQNEKTVLENEKVQVSAEQQLSYTLEIQEVDAMILELQYNLSMKEKEIQKMQETLNSLEVKSPVDGIIQSIHENNETDEQGNELPYITVVETGTYRIKGYINENNAAAISEGIPVLVHSRVDERTWNGSVVMIDWDNPMQQENTYMSYGNDTVSSSKYAFYVELAEDDGLMMGQHVYLEMNYGQTEEGEDVLLLPSYYLNDLEGNPWVWVQDEDGNLEKRKVVLGEYEEESDCYFITEGIEAVDFIAFPEESLKEGMKCILFDESAIESADETLDEPSMSKEAEVME